MYVCIPKNTKNSDERETSSMIRKPCNSISKLIWKNYSHALKEMSATNAM